MKKTVTITPPTGVMHGNDLALAAICLAARCQHQAGAYDHGLRKLFEESVDMLQRQAKRVAMQAFDDAGLQATLDEQNGKKHDPAADT